MSKAASAESSQVAFMVPFNRALPASVPRLERRKWLVAELLQLFSSEISKKLAQRLVPA